MRISHKKPDWQKTIAQERIAILFGLAQTSFSAHPERAHRYVGLARTIAKRYTIKLKREYRRRFCSACSHLLVPGANCTVRSNPSQQAMIIHCTDCGHFSRLPYRKEKRTSI